MAGEVENRPQVSIAYAALLLCTPEERGRVMAWFCSRCCAYEAPGQVCKCDQSLMPWDRSVSQAEVDIELARALGWPNATEFAQAFNAVSSAAALEMSLATKMAQEARAAQVRMEERERCYGCHALGRLCKTHAPKDVPHTASDFSVPA